MEFDTKRTFDRLISMKSWVWGRHRFTLCHYEATDHFLSDAENAVILNQGYPVRGLPIETTDDLVRLSSGADVKPTLKYQNLKPW